MEINSFSRLVKIGSSGSTASLANTPSLADVEMDHSSGDDDNSSDDGDSTGGEF